MQKIDLVYMWVDCSATTDEMRARNKKWLEWKFPEKSSFEK